MVVSFRSSTFSVNHLSSVLRLPPFQSLQYNYKLLVGLRNKLTGNANLQSSSRFCDVVLFVVRLSDGFYIKRELKYVGYACVVGIAVWNGLTFLETSYTGSFALAFSVTLCAL